MHFGHQVESQNSFVCTEKILWRREFFNRFLNSPFVVGFFRPFQSFIGFVGNRCFEFIVDTNSSYKRDLSEPYILKSSPCSGLHSEEDLALGVEVEGGRG